MSELTLKFDGYEHRGWTEVKVDSAMEAIASSFELKLTESWNLKKGGLKARNIETDMPCEITIDGEQVMNGYVDEAPFKYDDKSHTLSVKGRSKAGDLVDCSREGDSFSNQTLLQLAIGQCKPFGISVTSNITDDKPFKLIKREDGQTIFEFLEEAARIRAALLVSDPLGNLIITRASDERIETPLILGENIKAGSGNESRRDRFTEYTVQSQTTSNDLQTAGSVAFINGKAVEKPWRNKRYRPTVMDAEGMADLEDCKRRAEWQRNVAFGRGQRRTYTVVGWRHADGLWLPNRLVSVDDQWAPTMPEPLIVHTRFILDKNGQRTDLTLMPKAAFELVELPDPVYEEEVGL